MSSKWDQTLEMFSRTVYFYPRWGPSFLLWWNITKWTVWNQAGGATLNEPCTGDHTPAQAAFLTQIFSDGWNPWVPSRDKAGGQKPFQPIRRLLLSWPPSGSYRPLQRANSSTHKTETSFCPPLLCGRGTAGFIQIDSHPQLKGFRKMSRHDHN